MDLLFMLVNCYNCRHMLKLSSNPVNRCCQAASWSSRTWFKSHATMTTVPKAAATPSETPRADVLIQHNAGGVMHVVMNRPSALNAGHHGMVSAILKAIPSDAAQQVAFSGHAAAPVPGPCPQPAIKAVLIEGCSPKAFCSGGDVKALRQAVMDEPYQGSASGLPPEGHLVEKVFQSEYQLVVKAAACPVPYISLIRGVWMGLGFGLAGFGSARVVAGDVTFAMPENAIGLWPDVGWITRAVRAPGTLGLYLGLTGARVTNPADLLYLGLATHYVPEDSWEDLRSELLSGPRFSEPHEWACEVLSRYAQPPSILPPRLQLLQPLLDRCFAPAMAYKAQSVTLAQALQGICDRLETELQGLQSLRPHHQQGAEINTNTSSSSNTTSSSSNNNTASGACAANAATSPTAVPASHSATTTTATNSTITTVDREDAAAVLRDALNSLQTQCPFSLATTLAHYARVARDVEEGGPLCDLRANMEMEYSMAVRGVARPDFAEGVRAALVDKCRCPVWAHGSFGEISDDEVEALMTPLFCGQGLI